jgi:hypothetical protein
MLGDDDGGTVCQKMVCYALYSCSSLAQATVNLIYLFIYYFQIKAVSTFVHEIFKYNPRLSIFHVWQNAEFEVFKNRCVRCFREIVIFILDERRINTVF